MVSWSQSHGLTAMCLTVSQSHSLTVFVCGSHGPHSLMVFGLLIFWSSDLLISMLHGHMVLWPHGFMSHGLYGTLAHSEPHGLMVLIVSVTQGHIVTVSWSLWHTISYSVSHGLMVSQSVSLMVSWSVCHIVSVSHSHGIARSHSFMASWLWLYASMSRSLVVSRSHCLCVYVYYGLLISQSHSHCIITRVSQFHGLMVCVSVYLIISWFVCHIAAVSHSLMVSVS